MSKTLLERCAPDIESAFENIAKQNGPHCHFLGNITTDTRPRYGIRFDSYDREKDNWIPNIFVNPGIELAFGNDDNTSSPFSLNVIMSHDRGISVHDAAYLAIMEQEKMVHDALIALGFSFDTKWSEISEFHGVILASNHYEISLPRRTASIENALEIMRSVFNIRQTAQDAIDALLQRET